MSPSAYVCPVAWLVELVQLGAAVSQVAPCSRPSDRVACRGWDAENGEFLVADIAILLRAEQELDRRHVGQAARNGQLDEAGIGAGAKFTLLPVSIVSVLLVVVVYRIE